MKLLSNQLLRSRQYRWGLCLGHLASEYPTVGCNLALHICILVVPQSNYLQQVESLTGASYRQHGTILDQRGMTTACK